MDHHGASVRSGLSFNELQVVLSSRIVYDSVSREQINKKWSSSQRRVLEESWYSRRELIQNRRV